MYRSILVPLDGLTTGEQALPLVLALARGTGAGVHLVYVHEARSADLEGFTPFRFEGVEYAERGWAREAREHEAAYMEALAGRLGVPVASTATLEDPTASRLKGHAEACGADLIAMAVHGAADGWMDAVAEGLIHGARLPLLLIPPGAAPQGSAAFERVLIPLDGSDFAEQVIRSTLDLDPERRAHYTLFKVLGVARRASGDGYTSYGLRVAESDVMRREALALGYLEAMRDRLRARGYQVDHALAIQPDPGAEILKAAELRNADLIAMATHGRGGLTRLLLGSVATDVLRGASRPILLYRPEAFAVA